MSKHNRPRLSLKGDPNALTTAPIEQAQVATSEPTQERPMEASQENNQEALKEVSAQTVKALAAAEEENSARKIALSKQNQEDAEKGEMLASQSTLSAAAQGRESLRQAFEAQKERSKPKPYVPPPRTERQMAALQEELEAGRRTQQRAQEQLDNRPVPKPDPNEGFTTPQYRPDDFGPRPGYGKTALLLLLDASRVRCQHPPPSLPPTVSSSKSSGGCSLRGTISSSPTGRRPTA